MKVKRCVTIDNSIDIRTRIESHISVLRRVSDDRNLINSIEKAAKMIADALSNGGALYLCGNGGSAADAQHIATEFVSRFYKERRALNAEALTTNTSSITAIGNDYSFSNIFVRQLEAKGRRGDVLVGISTSGASVNVIKAMEFASQNGMQTILLTGNRDNVYNLNTFNCVIKVPSDDTPRIQETHILIGHIWAEFVESILG